MIHRIYEVALGYHVVVKADSNLDAEEKVRNFITEHPEELLSTVTYRGSYDDLMKGEEEK